MIRSKEHAKAEIPNSDKALEVGVEFVTRENGNQNLMARFFSPSPPNKDQNPKSEPQTKPLLLDGSAPPNSDKLHFLSFQNLALEMGVEISAGKNGKVNHFIKEGEGQIPRKLALPLLSPNFMNHRLEFDPGGAKN